MERLVWKKTVFAFIQKYRALTYALQGVSALENNQLHYIEVKELSQMKLYELTEQWETVFNMMEDGETDEQVIFDTLESIEGEIEDKADNHAKMIRNLQANAEVLKAEEERLYKRRKSTENHIQRLKDNLQANLEFIGKTKFKTDLFSFSISKNGGKQPLSITDNLDEIPGKYLIPQPPKVNNDAVRELLKDKEVEWAHLEPYGRHLNIR